MDSSILDLLNNASTQYGIPTPILYSIVMTESGGNPNAQTVTPYEDSRGLFQVNVKAHMDANSTQLFNPEYNINYQVPNLKTTYDQGVSKGLSGVALAQYVEQYGQRPLWTPTVASSISKYYTEYTGGKMDTSTPGTTSSTGSILGMNINSIIQGYKFSIVYVLLFALLIFVLYVVFVKGGSK